MDRGQSLIIPHLFDGTNYAYWEVRMRAFLQSLDEKVWQAVEIGWAKPKEVPTDWETPYVYVLCETPYVYNQRTYFAHFV